MGQTNCPVAFHAETASPSGDGLPVVVSEPITVLTPEEFWALLAMDLRGRLFSAPEALEARSHGGPSASKEGLVVMQADRIYEWFLYSDIDEAECYCYGQDATLSKLESRGTLKVLREPFRLEYWNLVYGQRQSGENLRIIMNRILRTMRSKANCSLDVDSPGGSGLKCVLSDPIHDSLLSPSMFWKQTKEVITKKSLKTTPDGGIVQKAATGWELFSSQETYTKHIFHDATKEIVSYTYQDLELTDIGLQTIRHLRIHTKPYRLEMWIVSADKRHAGDAEKQEVIALLQSVLEQARQMATAPNALADTAQLSSLYHEVTEFRKEMSHAMQSLHEGAGALEAW